MERYQITFTMKDGKTQSYTGIGQPTTDGVNTIVITEDKEIKRIPKSEFVHFHII